MSANYNDDVPGPFDGPSDGGSYPSDYLDDYVAPGGVEDRAASSGLEVVGGALFLAGCLPAASVTKALLDGTNLAAPGLKGPAALAAGVVKWVGPWPALLATAAIAIVGALMVLGSLRREPLRRVAGAMVCGLGLAAILSAIHGFPAVGEVGAGGQIGSGTGARLGAQLGSWAGVVLGLGVMAGAVWLGFIQADEVDEDDGLGPIIEHDEAPRGSFGSAAAKVAGTAAAAMAGGAAAVSSALKGKPRNESDVIGKRADRQRRVSAKKPRRRGAPATLGDALARGGAEGVSHDEAAALAPDEKTLAYMEDVWRQASHPVVQPEPIPRSPYPEDVRLKGEIPEGAAPLEPRADAAAASGTIEKAQPAGSAPGAAPSAVPGHPLAPSYSPPAASTPAQADADVAPFDFADELSAPKPLGEAPPPTPVGGQAASPEISPVSPSDPFGSDAPALGLSPEEADAYTASSSGLTQGVRVEGPSELPAGVSPYVPKSPSSEESVPAVEPAAAYEVVPELPTYEAPALPQDAVDALSKQALQAGAMPASVSPPPRPAWEVGYEDEEGSIEMDTESIPEVDESGRWERRESLAPEHDFGGDPLEAPAEAVLKGEDDGLNLSALDELLAEADRVAAGSMEPGLDALGAAANEEVYDEEEIAEAEFEDEIEVAPLAESVESPVAVEVPAVEEPVAEDSVIEEFTEEVIGEEALADELEVQSEEDLGEDAEEDEDSDEDSEEEYEEDAEDELEEVEEAELEDGEEEVEYEYVDEDGNPIDPSELSDEYELVDVDAEDEADEDEEEEDAEYEEEEAEEEEGEYEEYEEEYEDDEEAAELEEDDEEAAEGEEVEEEEGEEEDPDAEYEEYDEIEEDEPEELEALDEADEMEAESDAEGAVEAVADAPETLDHVLEPQPPPAQPAEESAAESAAEEEASVVAAASVADDPGPGLSSDGARILEAGRLVVGKDRAAVSVIQKGFDVEFAEACSILEELHAQGLIGPYQEGKKRAILLSLEEWEGRFAHS